MLGAEVRSKEVSEAERNDVDLGWFTFYKK